MNGRQDKLWPVLTVMVGLLAGVGLLEEHARKREADAIVIEIHGDAERDDEGDSEVTEVVGAAHAKARTDALRGDIDGAIARLEAELALHPDSHILLLELGHWMSARGRNKDALLALEKAKGLAPNDARIPFELGLARRKAGDPAGAETELRAALALNPSHSSARVSLAELLRRRGALDEAIATVEPATKSGGNDARARASVALGRAYLTAKRTADAERAFEQAINWAPAAPEIRASIARAYLDSGTKAQATRALALAQAAAELAPDIPVVYATIGRAKEALGADAEALEAYEHALRLDPTDRYARIRSIRLSLGRGDFAGARQRAERLVADAPDTPEHHFLLGLVAAKSGRVDDARAAYSAALERASGDYPEALFNLGILEARQGQTEAAIAAYRRAIDQRQDYLEAYNNLGLLYAGRKDLPQAEAAYRQAIAKEPNYVAAWFNLAKAQADLGKPEDALASLERAVVIDPKNRKSRLELGVIYAQSGRFDDAIRTYRALLVEEPRYVAALYDLALALEAKGDPAAARAELDKALAIDPDHVRSRRKLGAVALKLGEPDTARVAAEELLEREPGDRASRLLLARAHAARRDVAACRQAVTLAGPEPGAASAERSLEGLFALCLGTNVVTSTAVAPN